MLVTRIIGLNKPLLLGLSYASSQGFWNTFCAVFVCTHALRELFMPMVSSSFCVGSFPVCDSNGLSQSLL